MVGPRPFQDFNNTFNEVNRQYDFDLLMMNRNIFYLRNLLILLDLIKIIFIHFQMTNCAFSLNHFHFIHNQFSFINLINFDLFKAKVILLTIMEYLFQMFYFLGVFLKTYF